MSLGLGSKDAPLFLHVSRTLYQPAFPLARSGFRLSLFPAFTGLWVFFLMWMGGDSLWHRTGWWDWGHCAWGLSRCPLTKPEPPNLRDPPKPRLLCTSSRVSCCCATIPGYSWWCMVSTRRLFLIDWPIYVRYVLLPPYLIQSVSIQTSFPFSFLYLKTGFYVPFLLTHFFPLFYFFRLSLHISSDPCFSSLKMETKTTENIEDHCTGSPVIEQNRGGIKGGVVGGSSTAVN